MLLDKIAQYKESLSLAFCIVFSLTSLIWNSNFVVKNTVTNSRKVENFIASKFQWISGLWGNVSDKMESYESILEKNKIYEKKIEEYENILANTARIKNENDKLNKILAFQPNTTYPFVKAKVLTVHLNSIYRTIIINKGTSSGVRVFMPVVTHVPEKNVKQAVVGKIIAVTENSSIVQPLVNSNFSMGVRMPGVNLWAILSGNSGKGLQVLLNYIDSRALKGSTAKSLIQKDTELSNANNLIADTGLIGKPVFTSGGSGIFPPNIPVGIIREEGVKEGSFKTAYAEPFVDFGVLEYVTVIKKLPEKWSVKWPANALPKSEQPIFGENVFPQSKKKVSKKSEKKKQQ
ncbi:MAG: rod shape-determining protein MreC [Spirochaetota bacterium]